MQKQCRNESNISIELIQMITFDHAFWRPRPYKFGLLVFIHSEKKILPLFVQHAVDRLFSLSSKNTIHLAHNFCAYNARYEKAVLLLNLIQYNMSPCLTPILPLTRESLVKEGKFLKLCQSQFSVKPHPITIGLILIGADRFFLL